MPRPKVRPEDRRRSVKACDTCKQLKKRCDSLTPCTPCTKKGIPESCGYSEKTRGQLERPLSPPQITSSKHKRSASAFSLAPSSSCAVTVQASHGPATFEDTRDNTRDNTRENTPAPYVGQKPVMLLSSTGEKGMRAEGNFDSLFTDQCYCSICWQHSSTVISSVLEENIETIRWRIDFYGRPTESAYA